MATRSVFATVGTTQFDSFIQHLTSEDVLKVLKKKGYDNLTMQIGKGVFIPTEGLHHGVNVKYFRFKDTLKEDMNNADLILSHAGAGSCLESLELNKALLVVVNEELMDNHQMELAEQFSKDGYLYYCNVKNLKDALETNDFKKQKLYVKGCTEKFGEFLDQL